MSLETNLDAELNALLGTDLIGEVNELSEAEVKVYAECGPDSWPQVQRISHRHHRIAQMLALGETPTVICRALDIASPATISRLKESPAFASLVQSYQEEVTDRDAATQMEMRAIGASALQKMHTQICEGNVTHDDLRKTAIGLLDRTGHSPVQKTESKNLNIHISAEKLEELKDRARVVDGTLHYDQVRASRSDG